MSSDNFCLSWSNFEHNIGLSFRELREEKDFFDVTLSCGEEQIQAHKVILSACSPFFRNVFKTNVHQHPLLYLKGVKFSDLQTVLNFMYHGEVEVAQEELNTFLAVAEDLKVKGLTQNINTPPRVASTPNLAMPKPSPDTDSVPTAYPKSPRSVATPNNPDNLQLQEVVQLPWKSEAEARDLPSPTPGAITQELYTQVTVPTGPRKGGHVEDLHSYQLEENYKEFGGYNSEQSYDNSLLDTKMNSRVQGPSKGQKREFETFMQANASLIEGGKWSCFLCGKVTSHIGNMRQHFETYHYKTSDSYNCKFCSKQCPTKNALACHTVKCRRKL